MGMENMKIFQLSDGDAVHRYKKSIVIPFGGKRKVLSTSPLNGGYRTDLKAVFNNDGNPGAGIACAMRAPTYKEHMALIAEKDLGLDPEYTAGISTAASMENVSVRSEAYDDFTVTAIVTGGIEVNGGRVGDIASWHEKYGTAEPVKLGTINIILVIDADMPEGTLARALVTCTEAKTAAIQELLAPSRYSMGLATGSGTDGTILIANTESQTYLTNAGKHSKLGEYIGRNVKEAVKEALRLQSGLSPVSQHHILKRMDRFGITEDTLWETCLNGKNNKTFSRAEFSCRMDALVKADMLVTYTSLYAHLLDQLSWELINIEEAKTAGRQLLRLMGMKSDSMITDMASMIEIFKCAFVEKILNEAET